MSRSRARFLRSGHACGEIRELLAEVEKKGPYLDLPAGSGVNAPGIREAGFEPVAWDLFSREVHEQGIASTRLDFNQPLPFASGSFAAVVCGEASNTTPRSRRWLRSLRACSIPAAAC